MPGDLIGERAAYFQDDLEDLGSRTGGAVLVEVRKMLASRHVHQAFASYLSSIALISVVAAVLVLEEWEFKTGDKVKYRCPVCARTEVVRFDDKIIFRCRRHRDREMTVVEIVERVSED